MSDYKVNYRYKEFYNFPERFSYDWLVRWCEENDENLDYMLDEVVDVDLRDDYELARDVSRPFKDRLLEVHNILVKRDMDYPAIAKMLEINDKTLTELMDYMDIISMFYELHTEYLKSLGLDETLKKTYRAWEMIEDVMYDATDGMINEVAQYALHR